MTAPPILSNIIKMGVIPEADIVEPIDNESEKEAIDEPTINKEEENVIAISEATPRSDSQQLSLDDIELIIDSRLESLKVELLRDFELAIKQQSGH